MPVLNEADQLFLNGPVRRVLLGDDVVWETTWPWIDSIVPEQTEGTANVLITVHGSGFVTGGMGWWVDAATPNNAAFGGAYSAQSANQLTVTMHHLKLADFLFWVTTNPDGTGPRSNRVLFRCVSVPPAGPPVITGTEPASATTTDPITSMDVLGSGFVDGAVVWIGGAACPTTFVDAGRLTAQWNSPATPIEVSVQVQNPDGQLSGLWWFSTIEPSPLVSITSLEPNSAPAGSMNVAFTVRGENFSDAASCYVYMDDPVNGSYPLGGVVRDANTIDGVSYWCDQPSVGQVSVRWWDGTEDQESNRLPFTVT